MQIITLSRRGQSYYLLPALNNVCFEFFFSVRSRFEDDEEKLQRSLV